MIEIDRNRPVLFDYSAYKNTLEIDNLLDKKHRLMGVYARNRLPRLLNVSSALVGNTDPDHRMGKHWVAIYIDANSMREYYNPTGRPPFLRAYVNFMKHCHTWTYNTVRVQEEGYTVWGYHCIFYLIHGCAGHTMTDVTRLLENPVKATTIVKKIYLLLVKHMLFKKNEKK